MMLLLSLVTQVRGFLWSSKYFHVCTWPVRGRVIIPNRGFITYATASKYKKKEPGQQIL